MVIHLEFTYSFILTDFNTFNQSFEFKLVPNVNLNLVYPMWQWYGPHYLAYELNKQLLNTSFKVLYSKIIRKSAGLNFNGCEKFDEIIKNNINI